MRMNKFPVVFALFAFMASVAFSGCQPKVEATAEKEKATAQTVAVKAAPKIIKASEADPFASLSEVKVIAEGGFMAPLVSPAGDRVAFTKRPYKGLFVMNLENGEIKEMTGESKAGYYPLWSATGDKISYRVPGQKFTAVPQFTIDMAGKDAKPFSPHPNLRLLQKNDKILLKDANSVSEVSPGGDKFFAPVLSGDKKFIVYNGLKTGVSLYRIKDGTTINIGAGNHPTFSADGNYLVFYRPLDDGHTVTASEIFITDLNDANFRTAQLTDTEDVKEKHPSMYKGALYYSADGKIYSAKIRELVLLYIFGSFLSKCPFHNHSLPAICPLLIQANN